MAETLSSILLTPADAATRASEVTAPNGVRYSTAGQLDTPNTTPLELARLAGTVPQPLAAGLARFVYCFVPLVLSGARLEHGENAVFNESDHTLIAPVSTSDLADKAICHRNAFVGADEYVFLSSRLHNDKFALAFEFFINVAHNFVDTTGTPVSFGELAWKQATTGVRGETSLDAWEERAEALGQPLPGAANSSRTSGQRTAGRIDEKARSAYQAAAFSDALAMYLLSLYLDFDYTDLREREYPLLSAPALAERLRAVHKLFPPNEGYSFQILYRRRG